MECNGDKLKQLSTFVERTANLGTVGELQEQRNLVKCFAFKASEKLNNF